MWGAAAGLACRGEIKCGGEVAGLACRVWDAAAGLACRGEKCVGEVAEGISMRSVLCAKKYRNHEKRKKSAQKLAWPQTPLIA